MNLPLCLFICVLLVALVPEGYSFSILSSNIAPRSSSASPRQKPYQRTQLQSTVSPASSMLQDEYSTRRRFLTTLASASSFLLLAKPLPARAQEGVTDRNDLLAAIAQSAPDDEVIDIIHRLKDPSNGKGATYRDRLDGQWELIWSYKAEAFSPLLKLPKPLKPQSYQYLGSAADREVGTGRIAQGLTGGILGSNQFWLSSGAVPFDADPSVLEIQPPFRFELGGRYGTGVPKKMIVEAGSDAEFRKVNARTKEAQAAGKNQYQQMYLENDGPGSLRVSSVIAGDPVIVGEIFVHRKL